MKPSSPSTSTLDDKRRRAYQAGGRITRDRMTREDAKKQSAVIDRTQHACAYLHLGVRALPPLGGGQWPSFVVPVA